MGITATIAAIGEGIAAASAAVGSGAVALGVGAETAAAIGSGVVGAGLGAVGGGAVSALQGGSFGTGALTGALTGGAIGGLGSALGGATGLGTIGGDVIAGAGGGALGAGITGGDPLTGAAGGALSGGVAGVLSGAGGEAATPGTAPAASAGAGGAGSPGVGAAGVAAPPSVSAGDPGSVGAALAATDPASAAIPGPPSDVSIAGVSGTAPPPAGTAMAPADAAAVQASTAGAAASGTNNTDLSVLGHQISGTNAVGSGLSTNAAGNPELNTPSAATEGAPGAGGPTTTQVSPNVTETTGLGSGSGTGTAAGTPAGTTNWSNFSNDPFGTVGKALTNNAWLVPAAGLALSAGKDMGTSAPNSTDLSNTLQGQANQLQANSATLQGYLSSGTLPAGVTNSIRTATNSAKASIKSQYASRGMSGSSAEAQDLAAVDNNASSQGSQIAIQLLNTGVTEAGLADQIYAQLLSSATARDNQLSQAIGTFASSMVPRTPTNITVNSAG